MLTVPKLSNVEIYLNETFLSKYVLVRKKVVQQLRNWPERKLHVSYVHNNGFLCFASDVEFKRNKLLKFRWVCCCTKWSATSFSSDSTPHIIVIDQMIRIKRKCLNLVLKLVNHYTGSPRSQHEELLLFLILMRTFSKMWDITTDIYYYITTKFVYTKHDHCIAACGVMLQQFEFIKVSMWLNVI